MKTKNLWGKRAALLFVTAQTDYKSRQDLPKPDCQHTSLLCNL
jgi:hypothetical protein